MDVSIQIQPIAKDLVKLVADKLRDREVTAPVAEIHFESRPVWGEVDEMGGARTTRVVRPTQAFEEGVVDVGLALLDSGARTYDDWRAACEDIPKGLFDRLAVAVLGDPETWGREEVAPGVYVAAGR